MVEKTGSSIKRRKNHHVVGYRTLALKLAKAQKDIRAAKGERVAYVAALSAICEFLIANGVKRDISCWLAFLGGALTELDEGIVAPFLKAHSSGNPGRPPIGWRDASRQMWAGVAMKVLCKQGYSVEQASKQVAEAAGMLPTQVIEITKKIGKGTAPERVKERYWPVALHPQEKQVKREAAHDILATLRRLSK
jgi:hypothetical protein